MPSQQIHSSSTTNQQQISLSTQFQKNNNGNGNRRYHPNNINNHSNNLEMNNAVGERHSTISSSGGAEENRADALLSEVCNFKEFLNIFF